MLCMKSNFPKFLTLQLTRRVQNAGSGSYPCYPHIYHINLFMHSGNLRPFSCLPYSIINTILFLSHQKKKIFLPCPFSGPKSELPPPPRGPHSIHSMMEIKYSCFLLLLLLLLPPPPAAFGCERAASPQRRGKKGQQKSPRPPSLAAEVLVECCAAFLCSGLRKEGHR